MTDLGDRDPVYEHCVNIAGPSGIREVLKISFCCQILCLQARYLRASLKELFPSWSLPAKPRFITIIVNCLGTEAS